MFKRLNANDRWVLLSLIRQELDRLGPPDTVWKKGVIARLHQIKEKLE